MWSGLYKGVLCNNYGCLGECCAGMCYIISTAISGSCWVDLTPLSHPVDNYSLEW